MATEALDYPRHKLDRRVPASLVAVLRYWRRQRSRRLRLLQVLAETSDPRIIEEAGFARPVPGIVDLWAMTLLHHHRPHG